MATIVLIRHAEPAVQGVFLGQLDPSLSQAGSDFARRTLAEIEVAIVYCSPLRRARETAEHLAAPTIKSLPELVEMNYGDWTGKTWSEIQEGWRHLAHRKSADWLGVTPPGGESWQQVTKRAKAAWKLIRLGPMPAAVVAHVGINAALATLIDGRDPLAFSQEYGGVISLEYNVDEDRANHREDPEQSRE